MKWKIISSIFVLFLLLPLVHAQIWAYKTFEQRLILVANDIDYELNKDTFNTICMENDWELLRVAADQFYVYEEESFIVVLGGVDAYNGIGEIVEDVLTNPQGIKTHSGYHRFLVENHWARFQEIVVLAGEDREHTKEAVEIFKDHFLEYYEEGIKKAFTRDFLSMYEKDLSKLKEYEDYVRHHTETSELYRYPYDDSKIIQRLLENLEEDYDDMSYILEYKVDLSKECEEYILNTLSYVRNIAVDYRYFDFKERDFCLDELNNDHRDLWRLNKDVWTVIAETLGKIKFTVG